MCVFDGHVCESGTSTSWSTSAPSGMTSTTSASLASPSSSSSEASGTARPAVDACRTLHTEETQLQIASMSRLGCPLPAGRRDVCNAGHVNARSPAAQRRTVHFVLVWCTCTIATRATRREAWVTWILSGGTTLLSTSSFASCASTSRTVSIICGP